MKNNSSVSPQGAQVTWLRAARRVLACGALLVAGVSSAIAQQFATSTVGGNAPTSALSGNIDGTGTGVGGSRFSNPQGIAVDTAAGFVYIADSSNHKIRRLTISTGAVATIAGSGLAGYNNAIGAAAQFNTPQGIALEGTGNTATLYVADTFNYVIRKITLSDNNVTLFAGSPGSAGINATSTPVATAKFDAPRGVAVVGSNLYVADAGNHAIRLISGGNVTVFAGSDSRVSGTTSVPVRSRALTIPTRSPRMGPISTSPITTITSSAKS